MQPRESGVQYSQWKDSSLDEVSMVAMSDNEGASPCKRVCQKLCMGKLGITVKVVNGVVLFYTIFILGYATGYYVHKCT
ncbi:PREDICTED: small integral membrane protein 1-like [Chrysochloris asiatica]|uniref:Small integral membrane protein 1-like n=1 Tax=Chrysochloris asiatica TaxID=185453 RepID=A0A9B0U654_CHRAS|nr:PREDICTED: small integral membrane protein 1-like [Chrysochloris asiatica]